MAAPIPADEPKLAKARSYPLGPRPPEESQVPLWWADPTVVILPGLMFATILVVVAWALMQPVVSELKASIKVFPPETGKTLPGKAEERTWAMVPGKRHRLEFEPDYWPQVAFQIDETGIQRIGRANAGEVPKLTVVTHATRGGAYIVVVAKRSMPEGHDTVERWFGDPAQQKTLVDSLLAMAGSTEVRSEAESQRRAVDALKLLDSAIQAAGTLDYSRCAACLTVETPAD